MNNDLEPNPRHARRAPLVFMASLFFSLGGCSGQVLFDGDGSHKDIPNDSAAGLPPDAAPDVEG